MTNLHCKSRKEAHKIHKVKVSKVMQLGSWHCALFVVLYERRCISGVASLSPKSNRKSLAARIRRRYSVSGGWREATIENTCAFAGCIRCDTYRQLTLFENKCSFALMLFICHIINYTGTVEPLYNGHFGTEESGHWTRVNVGTVSSPLPPTPTPPKKKWPL